MLKLINSLFDRWERHYEEKRRARSDEWFRGARAGRGSKVTTLPQEEHLRFAKRTYRYRTALAESIIRLKDDGTALGESATRLKGRA